MGTSYLTECKLKRWKEYIEEIFADERSRLHEANRSFETLGRKNNQIISRSVAIYDRAVIPFD